jgi:hypothetical protein
LVWIDCVSLLPQVQAPVKKVCGEVVNHAHINTTAATQASMQVIIA